MGMGMSSQCVPVFLSLLGNIGTCSNAYFPLVIMAETYLPRCHLMNDSNLVRDELVFMSPEVIGISIYTTKANTFAATRKSNRGSGYLPYTKIIFCGFENSWQPRIGS